MLYNGPLYQFGALSHNPAIGLRYNSLRGSNISNLNPIVFNISNLNSMVRPDVYDVMYMFKFTENWVGPSYNFLDDLVKPNYTPRYHKTLADSCSEKYFEAHFLVDVFE